MRKLRRSFKARLLLLCLILPLTVLAQQTSIYVDLAGLEGVEVNSNNIFSYQINNGSASMKNATVRGTLRYRNSRVQLSYEFNTTLQPGNNIFSKQKVIGPVWKFSSNGFKELFFDYNKLPQGTYEYCVEVAFKKRFAEESAPDPISSCVYYTVNDIFLLNLLEPEDNAKIQEYHPSFSWVANFPFASQLTYRLRIVELKKGQNNENAINRNNPIFQQKDLFTTNLIYPIAAKPLVKFQPYVWTVDAYYKDILLGGASPWRFTIVEDSLFTEKYVEQAHYDFAAHNGETTLQAFGSLKLRYITERMSDTLFLRLQNGKSEIKLPQPNIPLNLGDNNITIPFSEQVNLAHKGKYRLLIANKEKKEYIVPFVYLNPLYLK